MGRHDQPLRLAFPKCLSTPCAVVLWPKIVVGLICVSLEMSITSFVIVCSAFSRSLSSPMEWLFFHHREVEHRSCLPTAMEVKRTKILVSFLGSTPRGAVRIIPHQHSRERKVFRSGCPQTIVGQDTAQIRVIVKINTIHIPHFTFKPSGRFEHTSHGNQRAFFRPS